MKPIIIFSLFACFALASCESTEKGDTTTTNNPDTSVLVNDPDNTLNANPINDSTIMDTVHHDAP